MKRNAIMSFLRGKVRTKRRGTKTRQRDLILLDHLNCKESNAFDSLSNLHCILYRRLVS